MRRFLWLLLITAAVAQNTNQSNANWIVVGNEAQPIAPRHKKNIQEAISAAGPLGVVVIPPDYQFPSETFTNPNNILIMDFRPGTFAITGGGANFSGSAGGVAGTPNQIVVQSGVASLASPMITPGELNVTGNSAIEFNPDFICAYYGKINQNQLCSLNDLLVWNPIGANGDNWLLLPVQYSDIINNPPPNGTVYAWSSPDGVSKQVPNVFITSNKVAAGNIPQVYEAGILTNNEKIYTNTQALTAGAATHTLANSFSYTSSGTFGCQCTDQTGANACKAVPASATTVTLAGTGTDTLFLTCSGH